jgi:hypothetical protein
MAENEKDDSNEANAQLAALRASPHNGKMYQADDVDYMLALAEAQGRGLGDINPQWFRDQAKLIRGTLARLSAAERENERLRSAQGYLELEGSQINVRNLLYCVVRHAIRVRPYKRALTPWAEVADVCGVGSTTAHAICRAVGVDPDTGAALTPQSEGGEG